MIALIGAHARSFLRDPPGVVLTFLLPPLIFLLFAALFAGGGRGEVDPAVSVASIGAPGPEAEQGLRATFGDRLTMRADSAQVREDVLNGRADVGILTRGGAGAPTFEVISANGREAAAVAVAARAQAVRDRLSRSPPASGVTRRTVGPNGDPQASYYAAAVAVMFVFFAAMHGAMAGLDDRQSGLQARLALSAGGLGPVLGARVVWLTLVGVVQCAAVFLTAAAQMPPLAAWQWLATGVVALAAGLAAAGAAVLLAALCRTREQAQPLSTFLVLLLAALGGSMAPRFLMPAAFQSLGWLTPHAWAIEAWQTVIWRGAVNAQVVAGVAVLSGLGLAGGVAAAVLERRRLAG